ncbi:hypothetical protein ABFA07_000881 [Porites harrisoni]
MSAIVTTVFKATIGLLVRKGRAAAAEKLKEGDVVDQKFRRLILREIDDVKSKLDGLARKDLLSSFSSFAEGIEYLYEVFDRSKARVEYEEDAFAAQAAADKGGRQTGFLTRQMSSLDETDLLDDSVRKELEIAKKRFEYAREKARDAFANEALDLCDRILAMQYRVMATILQSCDSPQDALPACRVCIEELHSLATVKECFDVQLNKGFWARFSKDERRKVISAVCHLNRVIYDVTLMVGFGVKEWPYVDTGKEKIDPIRDERLTKLLRKQGMEHCFVKPWSFGQNGEKEQRVRSPVGIATNTREHFIVADDGDKSVKVFESNGNFLRSVSLESDDAGNTELHILDIATDEYDNSYVLIGLQKFEIKENEMEVQIFNTATSLRRKFHVKKGPWGQGRRLTICRGKVLVLRGSGSGDVVEVYKGDGRFVRNFGGGLIKSARDIAATGDHIMVMDTGDCSVRLFTLKGKHEAKITVDINGDYYLRAAFHPTGEQFVVAGYEREKAYPVMAVFTTAGDFVRRIQFGEVKTNWVGGMIVTMEGQVAVIVGGESEPCKVSIVAM